MTFPPTEQGCGVPPQGDRSGPVTFCRSWIGRAGLCPPWRLSGETPSEPLFHLSIFLSHVQCPLRVWPSVLWTFFKRVFLNCNLKRHMHPNDHRSTIHKNQATETTNNRGMDKDDVLHKCNGILATHEEEQNKASYSDTDGPRDDYTKWSNSERGRQIPCYITHMWDVNYDTNVSIHKKQTHRQKTDLWLPRRRGLGRKWTGSLGLVDANNYRQDG